MREVGWSAGLLGLAVAALGFLLLAQPTSFLLAGAPVFLARQASVLWEGTFGALDWSTGEEMPLIVSESWCSFILF